MNFLDSFSEEEKMPEKVNQERPKKNFQMPQKNIQTKIPIEDSVI